MIIQQTRVLSLGRHLGFLDTGDAIRLGIRLSDEDEERLEEIGFADGWVEGQSVLPDASLGPVSERNSEGDEIVHRDQPKETAHRQIEWEWVEWHGPYRERNSKIVDVPYERYPRTPVPPHSMELVATTVEEDQALIINEIFEYDPDDGDRLRHGINLLLEIFGKCEVFTEDLEGIAIPEVQRLNWKILPEGRYPWGDIEPHVEHIVRDKSDRERSVYFHRWRKIVEFDPEFVAVGRAGFRGYLIFGFPEDETYVLESAYYGNATYILGEDWDTLSHMTKAELLEDDLHEDRIIHREGWDQQIEELFAN